MFQNLFKVKVEAKGVCVCPTSPSGSRLGRHCEYKSSCDWDKLSLELGRNRALLHSSFLSRAMSNQYTMYSSKCV